MRKSVLTIGLALALYGVASAQNHFVFKLGGAFPMDKFADATVDIDDGDARIVRWGLNEYDNSNRGGAGTGITLGVEWQRPIARVNGFSLNMTLDAIYNGLNSDLREACSIIEDYWMEEANEFTLKKPNYFNIPLMVGFAYNYHLDGNLSLFASAGVGANLRIITPKYLSYTESESGSTYERTDEFNYDAAVSFAYRLGAGITLNQRYSIGIDYYALGDSRVKGERSEYEYRSGGGISRWRKSYRLGKVAPTMLMLRLGITL